MQNTFVVSKIDLKKMLSPLGVSAGSIEAMLSIMDKSHKHIDAIAFVGMLQKLGLTSNKIENILRRIGIDDTRIVEIFNSLDEEKIEATFGKVVDLKIN
ncbi:MAG: hypothetical protein QXD23_00445 [Candidatus Micrarchaeaceae archaeon]